MQAFRLMFSQTIVIGRSPAKAESVIRFVIPAELMAAEVCRARDPDPGSQIPSIFEQRPRTAKAQRVSALIFDTEPKSAQQNWLPLPRRFDSVNNGTRQVRWIRRTDSGPWTGPGMDEARK